MLELSESQEQLLNQRLPYYKNLLKNIGHENQFINKESLSKSKSAETPKITEEIPPQTNNIHKTNYTIPRLFQLNTNLTKKTLQTLLQDI